MAGKATLTIDTSRTTMNWAAASRTKINPFDPEDWGARKFLFISIMVIVDSYKSQVFEKITIGRFTFLKSRCILIDMDALEARDNLPWLLWQLFFSAKPELYG